MLGHTIHVKTDSFDGPLGLLLLLIEREEMSIRDLNINKITRQYLEYIERMQELNFDLAGDYLYMAAALVFLKSKSFVSAGDVRELIGSEAESELQISSAADLIKRLQELKHYQELGQSLWDLPKLGHEVYLRPRAIRKAMINTLVQHREVQELANLWIELLRREKSKYQVVKRDQLSIKEKLVFLKTLLQQGKQTNFFEVIDKGVEQGDHGSQRRDHAIVTFISLLELARLKKITLFQNEQFSNIFIDVLEPLHDFDVNAANGFEPETAQTAKAALH